MIVVGLDLSFASTGVAVTDGTDLSTRTLTTALRGPARLQWFRDQALDLTRVAGLTVIEGYAYSARNAGPQLGELGGVVRLALYEARRTYVDIAPASLKKWATGKGNAPKAQVHAAAVKHSGVELPTHDEADAYWLTQIGLAHLGLTHPTKERQAVLARITWPETQTKETAA